MKVHSTNYYDTFIEVSEDTRATCGTKPPSKQNKTVAEHLYDLISSNPYRFTSDEILFKVFAERNDLHESEMNQANEIFFSKGQPCFRASPLAKSYGFGIHFDAEGKVSIYGRETDEYQKLLDDECIKKVKAMRGGK